MMTSKAFCNMKVVALGGPSTATSWLYWGDPFFVRKTMRDLVKKNGGSFVASPPISFACSA